MNLDELVQSVPDTEKSKSILANAVDEWKNNAESLENLVYFVGKWHGNVWFESEQEQNAFWHNWQEFKTTAIDGIGGLTVNERLYWFGLFPVWEGADEEKKADIRSKIKANWR